MGGAAASSTPRAATRARASSKAWTSFLSHGGALQTVTGLATRDDASALAHRLADTFTELIQASGRG